MVALAGFEPTIPPWKGGDLAACRQGHIGTHFYSFEVGKCQSKFNVNWRNDIEAVYIRILTSLERAPHYLSFGPCAALLSFLA